MLENKIGLIDRFKLLTNTNLISSILEDTSSALLVGNLIGDKFVKCLISGIF